MFKNLDYALYANWYTYGQTKYVWDVGTMEELLPGMTFAKVQNWRYGPKQKLGDAPTLESNQEN